MIERKIGEVFEVNGRWLRCAKRRKHAKDMTCKSKRKEPCVFQNCELALGCTRTQEEVELTGRCSATYRACGKSVCFVKGEKP